MIQRSQHQIMNIRSVRSQIKSIAERSFDAGYSEEILEKSKDIELKLNGLEQLIYQTKIESSQDEINYRRRFTNHIIRLYRVVIDQDSKPSGGELERWHDLQETYEPFDEGYQNIMDNDIPEFRSLLSRHNVPSIISK